MPETYKGFIFEAHGDSSVLTYTDIPVSEPGPHEVLVSNRAIGLNFIDIYFREGLYPVTLPSRLGLEAAGVVTAVGAAVSRIKVGDRVAYCKGPLGAYAQQHIVPEDALVILPDNISFDVAAASLLKGLTAAYLLFKTTQAEGKTLLVHAAAGGVGSFLVPWARSLGCRVIGTAGSPEKAAMARASGCEEVILYREESVADAVKRLTDGRGVDIVYDSVGASTLDTSLQSLARRGLFVSFGNASGPVPPVAPLQLAKGGSLFMTRPALADYIADTDEMLELAQLLFSALEMGQVAVAINQRFPLADAAVAQAMLETRQTSGSTILIP